MPVEIPIRIGDAVTDSFEVSLDGRSYRFDLYWSERSTSWHVTISDPGGSPIVSGVRVCADWRLYARALPGGLVVVDTSGDGRDPGRFELGIGRRVQMLYFGEGE
jgi:hypothetical protein